MSSLYSKTAGSRAFSLIELLVTISVIAALSAISLPLAPKLLRTSQLHAGITTVAGTLEQARQHAMTHNTYVWVAFAPVPADKPQAGASMVVIESRGGIDTLNWTTDAVTLQGHADLALVTPVRPLAETFVADAGSVVIPNNMPAGAGAAGTASLETVKLNLTNSAGQTVTFTRAVQFTPDGRARVKNYTSQIELGLRSSLTSSANSAGQTADGAVLRVGSLSGKLRVYRPL